MDYLLLKAVHVTCVVITLVLFVGRGALMLAESPLRGERMLQIIPHVNDTVLLGSAVWMAMISHQYPFAESWLTAKLAALVLYVGVGMLALSYGRTKHLRTAAWLFALVIFAYIVAVAVARDPLPFVLH